MVDFGALETNGIPRSIHVIESKNYRNRAHVADETRLSRHCFKYPAAQTRG
jgi:hypothetical protein